MKEIPEMKVGKHRISSTYGWKQLFKHCMYSVFWRVTYPFSVIKDKLPQYSLFSRCVLSLISAGIIIKKSAGNIRRSNAITFTALSLYISFFVNYPPICFNKFSVVDKNFNETVSWIPLCGTEIELDDDDDVKKSQQQNN
jgi:hypothetical protein